jgi:hypothetical protein
MTLEFLNVNSEIIPHIVVPIAGDGACSFNSLSYLMYGNEQMVRKVRKPIVSHVTKNWTVKL